MKKLFGEKAVTVAPVTTDLNGMTYTELVSKELDTEMGRLRKEEKELTNGVREILAAIEEQGHHEELALMIVDLRKKLDKNAEEIKQAGVKYAVDPNLLIMAKALDRSEGTDRGIDLLYAIGPKVNGILALLPEIEKCYGGEYYAPLLFTQIKLEMRGLAQQFNSELPKLHKIDKEALKIKILDRMEALRASGEKVSTIKNKFKTV